MCQYPYPDTITNYAKVDRIVHSRASLQMRFKVDERCSWWTPWTLLLWIFYLGWASLKAKMGLEEKEFKVTHPSVEDLDTIWAFLEDQFFPDEPVCRSIGVLNKATWVDRFVRSEMRENLLKPCLQRDYSIVIWDSQGKIGGNVWYTYDDSRSGVRILKYCTFGKRILNEDFNPSASFST